MFMAFSFLLFLAFISLAKASGHTSANSEGREMNLYRRCQVLSGQSDVNISLSFLLIQLPRVFANTTQNYSGAELHRVR